MRVRPVGPSAGGDRIDVTAQIQTKSLIILFFLFILLKVMPLINATLPPPPDSNRIQVATWERQERTHQRPCLEVSCKHNHSTITYIKLMHN